MYKIHQSTSVWRSYKRLSSLYSNHINRCSDFLFSVSISVQWVTAPILFQKTIFLVFLTSLLCSGAQSFIPSSVHGCQIIVVSESFVCPLSFIVWIISVWSSAGPFYIVTGLLFSSCEDWNKAEGQSTNLHQQPGFEPLMHYRTG